MTLNKPNHLEIHLCRIGRLQLWFSKFWIVSCWKDGCFLLEKSCIHYISILSLSFSLSLSLYIYIYIYSECFLFTKEGHLLKPAKIAHVEHIWLLRSTSSLQALLHIGQAKAPSLTLTPIPSHIASQTCYRPMYFVKELTQVTFRLLKKDLCNICLQLFAVIRSHMTSKFGFELTDPAADVTNMFGLNSH